MPSWAKITNEPRTSSSDLPQPLQIHWLDKSSHYSILKRNMFMLFKKFKKEKNQCYHHTYIFNTVNCTMAVLWIYITIFFHSECCMTQMNLHLDFFGKWSPIKYPNVINRISQISCFLWSQPYSYQFHDVNQHSLDEGEL